MGESYGTRAHSPRYDAPSSIDIIERKSASFFSALTSTAFPSLKVTEKFSISSPLYERGRVATTVPSALPLIGEV